jgi:ketosteroid isomerase-like protein
VPSDRRALIDDLYRRLNARDTAVVDLCHPDIEWRWPEVTPGSSLFRGHEEMGRGLELWADSWDELVMETDEVLENGDYVLVMMTYRARGAGSGLYLEQPVAHLHFFEDGLLRRWWMFGDAEKARRRFVAGDRPG